MLYSDLSELLRHSSSSRRYFLSLPAKQQIILHAYSATIHSAAQLHRQAALLNQPLYRSNIDTTS